MRNHPLNRPIHNHPLVGSAPVVYRADLPAYDPDAPENKPGHPDFEPGTLVVGNGMRVGIKAVFQNWNGVPGLDMLYVYCMATGMHTHVTPFDVGLNPLDPDTATTEPFTTLVVERRDGWYYVGPFAPAQRIVRDEYGDFITETRVPVGHPDNGGWKHAVYEWRNGGSDTAPSLDGANQWGTGHTIEEAWRYLIGADFGPVDEEYDDDHLRTLIERTAMRLAAGA